MYLRQPQHFHSSHPVLKPTPAPSPRPPQRWESQLRLQAAGRHIVHSIHSHRDCQCCCLDPWSLTPYTWPLGGTVWRWPTTYLQQQHGMAQHSTHHVSTVHKRHTTSLPSCCSHRALKLAADTMPHQPHHQRVTSTTASPPVRPETPAALSRCLLRVWHTHCDAVLPLLTSRQHMRSTITSPPSSSLMYSSIT